MFRNNDKVNTQEAIFFIIASMIEVGTLTGASALTKEVGSDIWLVQILGHIFGLSGIFITVKLGQRFYKHSFVGYSRIIVGSILGWLLSAGLVIYWVFVSARVLRVTTNLIKLTLLNRTPVELTGFAFILICVYVCWYGIEPLCRISTFICLVIIPLILVITLISLSRFKMDNFLPFLAEGPLPVLKQSFKMLGDFEEMPFMLFLIPFLSNHKKAMNVAFIGFGIPAILGIFSICTHVGVLGVELAKLQIIPGIVALEAVEFPGSFIERMGVIFSGLWIIIVFPTLCGLLYASSLILSQMFQAKSHKPFILPLVPLIFLISRIPKNIIESQSFFKFLTPYGIIVLLFMPLLLYIVALMRGLKDV